MQPNEPSYKSVFESIWKIEKAVLETVDFEEATKQVVNIILTELGYINFGYEVIVLTLLDEQEKSLKRIAISNTEAAGRFIRATPIPFNDIVIPLWAAQNLSVRAINEKKMFVAENVSEILVPAIDREWVDNFQSTLGIKASIVFPIIAKDKVLGTLIFSLSKPEFKISDEEWAILNSFVGAVGIALDNALLFRSLKDTTRQLSDANKKLEELDKLKDEFVALVSHELRSPMTVIQGYVWTLLNEKVDNLSEEDRKRLERVYASTKRLIALVNENLDVSRIESGTMEFNPVDFDLVKLAVDVKEELTEKAAAKGVAIEVSEGNYNVYADRDKVHQVLLNFMDNASKFTPQNGKITVLFKVNEKLLETTVSDTGTGIKKEDLSKLFVKFKRLENSLSPVISTTGTGLGLYLSKKIIEKSGGAVWVESEFGKGSQFTFSLPMALPQG